MKDINTKKTKLIAYIGCLGMVGIISTEFGVIGILPQISEYYQIPIEKASYLLSAFAIVIAVTGPFMLLYTNRFNAKKVMLLATLLFLISNVLSFFQPSFYVLLVLRVIPAFLHPVFISLAINAAGKDLPADLQIRNTSIVVGGIALSQVSIIPLATYIAGVMGWEYAYLLQGIINLFVLLSILRFLPKNPTEKAGTLGAQLAILKKPSFIISIVMNFLLISAWFSSYSYFADYLNTVQGFDETQISYLLLLFGLMGVISNAVAGRMLSRNLMVTTVIFIAGSIILPFVLQMGSSSIVYGVISVAVWGLLYGPCFLTALTFMQTAAPEAKSFSNTLQTSFGNLGVSVGTLVSGLFIGVHGVEISPWIGAGFGLLALGTVWQRDRFDKKLILKTI